jgi:hypothetical protein
MLDTRRHVTALVLTALFVTSAPAQPPGGNTGAPPFMRGVLGRGIDPTPVPRGILILLPTAQDELKLSKAQRERIATLDRENLTRLDRLMEEFRTDLPPRDVDPATFQAMMEQVKAQREAMVNQTEASMLEILLPQQLARLDQIQLQAEGPLGFARPEVIKELALSPDQIKAVQSIVIDGREKMWATSTVSLTNESSRGPLSPEQRRTLLQSNEFKASKEKYRAATLKVREETTRQIAQVMTADQRAAYRKMLGSPFDLTKIRDEKVPSRGGAPGPLPARSGAVGIK